MDTIKNKAPILIGGNEMFKFEVFMTEMNDLWIVEITFPDGRKVFGSYNPQNEGNRKAIDRIASQ